MNKILLRRLYLILLTCVIIGGQAAFCQASDPSAEFTIIPQSFSLQGTSITDITICNNQLPYNWNGETYLGAGTYSVTLTGSDGADSIAVLNLYVNNVETSITNVSVCNNFLPYSWNGNNYFASGTYSVTLTTTSGCDSVPILSLTVNNVVTSTTNTTVCSNQLPYAWNGNSYAAAGTYTAILTSAAGCDSIATLHLFVKNISSSLTTISICASQLPYNWNGNSYSGEGIYTYTAMGSNGCDSIATLDLSVNTAANSSTHVTVCNNHLPYVWNGNSYLTAGTYTVILPGTGGCDSVATLILTVRAVQSHTTTVTVCTSQLPYIWNGNSYTASGIYPITLTSSFGCDSVSKLHLIVVPFLSSSVSRTVCTTQLPYLWNGNSYNAAGTYTVTLTSVAGCDSIVTLELTVATTISTVSNIIICSTQLPYIWNGNTYYNPGTYTIILTGNSMCDSLATLNLIVQPVIPSTTNTAVCSDQVPYNWNGNTYPSPGAYSVTLTGSSGCDSVANLNLTVIPVGESTTNITICNGQVPYNWNQNLFSETGTYPVILTSANGCDSIATLNLIVEPVQVSDTDITVCTNQLPYNWNGNNYSTPGSYAITLTGSGGCDSVATLNLTINSFLTSTTNITLCSSQLPYSWNGNTYSAQGLYPITFIASSGCDSIATLNLLVNTTVTSNTNLIICNSQLPFSWNGNVYNAAGSYSVALVSEAGCDSVAVLNLTISGAVSSSTDITICNNQLPYSWNGNSYPAGGSFPVMLITANGCDSIAILNLTVTEILTSTTNVTVCSSGLPYTWNGNVYTDPGTYSITTTNANGCDSVPILSLTLQPVITTIKDTSICSNQLPFSWNNNSYTAAGTYSITLTGSGGCDSISVLNLSVKESGTSTTDISICSNALPFHWNGNDYTADGIYPVTLTGSTGCDSIATLSLTVNQAGTSNTSISVCSNQLPYTWNGNSYPSPGIYTLTLTGSGGCDSVATLELAVIQPATSTTIINICSNQLPYTWNGSSYPAAGNYNVTLLSSSGCDSIATLNLFAGAAVTSTTDVSICTGAAPYVWNGNSYTATGTYSITLTGSGGCDSIAILHLVINDVLTSNSNISICSSQIPYNWNGNSYNSGGDYSVTLMGSGGCDSVAMLHLSVNESVTSNTNINICNNQLPYSWNGNSYAGAGIYTVTLISSGGCDSITTLTLAVNDIVTSDTNISICNNELPYNWNGNSYMNSGIYAATLISYSGCDSIATLHLTVSPFKTSETTVTVCGTQLPYAWNGNNYIVAGTYTATLVSAAGCDSVATLNLNVSQVLTSLTNITICNNQLPYSWNGNVYSTTGFYSIMLTSAGGCDSIAGLNLTATGTLTSTTNITVCSNQLPYHWNGISADTAGIYSVTRTTTSGCDSVATLHLTVNNILSSVTPVSICNNQLPYYWNNNYYSVTGTYNITLTGSSGCDSIASLVLTIRTASTSTTAVTICSNALPYLWNGQTYSTGGIHSVTLINVAGCDSTATLNLTVNPVNTSSTNASTCTNQLPYLWNGQSYSTGGAHSVTLTSSLGCDSIAILHLAINPVNSSFSTVQTCDNELPFTWNGQSYNTYGVHTVTLVSSAGCDSIATLNLIINPVTHSTTVVSICSAELPYIWNGQSYNSEGTYPVTLVNSNGCDSIATLNLMVNPTPGTPVTPPVTYCRHDITSAVSATITTPGSHLLWYTFATGGIGSAVAPVPSSNATGIITYYVSQVNGPCEGLRVPLTVTVNSKPDLGPDHPLQICFGQTANIAALYNTAGYLSNWTSNQVAVADPASVAIAGQYQLYVQNSFGCADTAIVKLGIQPPVTAHAGPDDNAVYNAPYQLSGSGGVQYQWSPSTFLNNPFIPDPVAVLANDETFILMVKDDIGCMAFDTVRLRVLKGPTFYVPTAFSPNGDGLNDIFRPTAVGIQSMEYFRVFNRYGELIFETSDLSKGWDGNFRGKKQGIGNYVWELKGTDKTGQVKAMRGNVVLIR